jgi:hypothetical protein
VPVRFGQRRLLRIRSGGWTDDRVSDRICSIPEIVLSMGIFS